MQSLVEFLLKQRHAQNLRQEQVAEKLNVSQTTYCRWEADQRLPSVPETVKISQLFTCDLTTLCHIICQSSFSNGY
jgi:transcriptional regulator with XRE-family HTH domain